MKNPQKVKNYFLSQWPTVLALTATGLLFNIFTVYVPVIQGQLIDKVIAGASLDSIVWFCAYYVGFIFVIQFARFGKRFFVRRFANQTNKTMRMVSYHNVIAKPIISLEKEDTGDLMTKIVGDVDITVEGIRKVTTEFFDSGVLMVAYIVELFIMDFSITGLSILFIPVAILIAESMKTIVYKNSRAYRTQMSRVTGTTYEIANHAILFRTHGVLDQNIDKYGSELTDLEKKAVRADTLETATQPIYLFVASCGVIFVIYMGGSRVIDGNWTIGTFLAYLAVFIALTVKASKTSKLFNSAQKATISWQRIKPYLTPIVAKDGHLGLTHEGTLDVAGLSFTYPNQTTAVISDIGFSAHKGQIIGITGPIACGKSTLGLALLGLFPYQGSIKINGKELRDYSDKERSALISYLGHDPNLFSDTIHNNVALGEKADLSGVLSDVAFSEDLQNMPDKDATLVGNNGVKLSGGQQARIGLARALLEKTPIIILDDPFSAVDTLTESQIIANIKKNYQDSIILIISHRLTIFPRVDSIIMFDDAGVKYGTHAEMLEESPLYKRIFELQGGDR